MDHIKNSFEIRGVFVLKNSSEDKLPSSLASGISQKPQRTEKVFYFVIA